MTRADIDTVANMTEGTLNWDDAIRGAMDTIGTGYDGNTGYATDIGNGTDTSLVVTHNLGNDNLCVHLYDNSTDEQVTADITLTTSSTLTVTFATAPATDAYRIVINPVRTS